MRRAEQGPHDDQSASSPASQVPTTMPRPKASRKSGTAAVAAARPPRSRSGAM